LSKRTINTRFFWLYPRKFKRERDLFVI
jgi:hypothetical protein